MAGLLEGQSQLRQAEREIVGATDPLGGLEGIGSGGIERSGEATGGRIHKSIGAAGGAGGRNAP